MRLRKRNLFYSMLLAGCMLIFLVGYFVYMLPSLYVDYTMEQNLESVRQQRRLYVETGSYAKVQVKNPTACFSVKLSEAEDCLYLTTKLFSVKITAKDTRIKKLFDTVHQIMQTYDVNASEEKEAYFDQLKNGLEGVFEELATAPVQIQVLEYQNLDMEYHGEYQKVHYVSNDFIIFEMGVQDAHNQYMNYIAVQSKDGNMIFTFLPVVTPDMDEIRPIVFQSLPMLGAIVFLLVLLFSQVYSGGIVSPIVRLVQHTVQMKNSRTFQVFPIDAKLTTRKDEIGTLAQTINALNQAVQKGYEELAKKNQVLAEENERQEVLLRATSHQLKTPIAAALLLVDGMNQKVGKYQDTELYLPKVKEQLLSMKKMVGDILYLNHCGENLDIQCIMPRKVLETQLAVCGIAIKEKQLEILFEGEEDVMIDTDETLFSQIIENLLSNVVNYTPQCGQIRICLATQQLRIQNYGVRIAEEILPHIFEPFVSGIQERVANSHGLGLYIAAYDAKKIGMQIVIYNEEKSVVANLLY